MQDEHPYRVGRTPRQSGARKAAAEGDVIDFASWVLALISARRAAETTMMRADILAEFRRLVSDPDPGRLAAFMAGLPGRGADATAVADLYIPALARMLGEDWLDDRSGFAEVSVASARLQSVLRDLGASWRADEARHGRGVVLLAVAPGEQHTLGAMVLLGQLRRAGVSVRLALGPNPHEAQKLMENGRFDGILLSQSCTHRLAQTRSFLDMLRKAARQPVPVAIGGSALFAGVLTPMELAEVTGADVATADLLEALAVFGLVEDVRGRVRTGR